MIRRPLAPLSLLLLLGCDVDSTVGFNERGGALVAGERCSADAPLGRCSDSPCVVTDLFEPGRFGTITIAADRDNAYFLTSEVALARRPLDDGASVELGRADSPVRRVTLDATFVYWTEQDGVVRGVPKTGGATFESAYVFGNPTDIAVDDEHLYWVLPPFDAVAMAPAPSGEATQITGQRDPQAIAVDATHVYWVNQGTDAVSGQLVRALRGDLASAEVVLSGLDAPIAVAVNQDAVYWASLHAVYAMRKAESGVAQMIASGFEDVKGIAVFGDTVYGAGMEGLWRLPAAGGELQLLDRRPMSAMTITCSGVYATGWFVDAFVRYAP
jgi:hypothetical protein